MLSIKTDKCLYELYCEETDNLLQCSPKVAQVNIHSQTHTHTHTHTLKCTRVSELIIP